MANPPELQTVDDFNSVVSETCFLGDTFNLAPEISFCCELQKPSFFISANLMFGKMHVSYFLGNILNV